uniref:ribosomal protein S11 n=1 Tax=Sporochnus bolleanus TaxID=461143 RepID=UPI002E79B7EE|nr:ribosomal protein S11 [Sporochnus bolleanus]WBP70339.1 ribosomal protein S11 [Sporochnus bolleanus]
MRVKIMSLIKNKKVVKYLSTSALKKKVIKKGGFGSAYITCTRGNIFCTLIDTLNGKVITSCSLRVPAYVNEYNERENLYIRGLLLGKLFSYRITTLGYNRIILYLNGTSKGRLGVVRSMGKAGIKVYAMVSDACNPHNGCRPAKARRKKFRSRAKR